MSRTLPLMRLWISGMDAQSIFENSSGMGLTGSDEFWNRCQTQRDARNAIHTLTVANT